MSERRPIKTTIKEVVHYWRKHVDECGFNVDWSEAETYCWRCGCKKNLQRCHIIPYTLGGTDQPANIVLLCSRCHAEGPNVADPDIMWDWIRAYRVPLYETFWIHIGIKEYKFIYNKNIFTEVNTILDQAGVSKDSKHKDELIENFCSQLTKKASAHFGQSYLNSATMAGLYRTMLKDMAKSLGVCFPVKDNGENKSLVPWWRLDE